MVVVTLAVSYQRPPFLQMSFKSWIVFGEKKQLCFDPWQKPPLVGIPVQPLELPSHLRLGIDSQDGAVLCWALVVLAGVLLAVHLFANPEMAAHLQVEPTVGANVAGRVAVAVLLDSHSLVSGEDGAEESP